VNLKANSFKESGETRIWIVLYKSSKLVSSSGVGLVKNGGSFPDFKSCDLDFVDWFPLSLCVGIATKCVSHPEVDHSQNQFDLIAPLYPALEQCVFGSQLNRARRAFFDAVVQADRILLVGEGNGRFLTLLLAHKNKGCINVVEKSAVMIRLAKERTRKPGALRCDVKFVEADVLEYSPAEKFDCAVTHFLLDLFNPAAQRSLIQRIAELTIPSGTWINVDFLPARTVRGRILMWSQYAFFRMASQIQARQCFDESMAAAAAGWTVAETVSYLGGLVVARRYQRAPVPAAGHNAPNPVC
jgi:SAM-dependent methyltransferase